MAAPQTAQAAADVWRAAAGWVASWTPLQDLRRLSDGFGRRRRRFLRLRRRLLRSARARAFFLGALGRRRGRCGAAFAVIAGWRGAGFGTGFRRAGRRRARVV